MIITPALLLTSALGIYVTLRMGRVLPRDIFFLPGTLQFKIKYVVNTNS